MIGEGLEGNVAPYQLDTYHNVSLSTYTAPRADPELRKTNAPDGTPNHSWYPGLKYSDDACVVDPETSMVYELKLDKDKEGVERMLNGTLLYEDARTGKSEEMTLRNYLSEKGVDNLLPFVGYGSNRNPAQMVDKFSEKSFSKYEDLFDIKLTEDEHRATQDPIVMVKGKGPGNVVYINRVSHNYQQPFALYVPPSEETAGEAEAWVTFITDRQVRPLHASENLYNPNSHYDLVKMAVETPIGKIDALAYGQVGTTHVLTNDKGEPVRLSAIESYSSSIADEREAQEVIDMIRGWVNKDLGTSYSTIEEFQNDFEKDKDFANRVNDYISEKHSRDIEIADAFEKVEDPGAISAWSIAR